MLERSRFVAEVASGEFSFSDSCERFGISRKTGYKWWRRYREEGVPGLADRSRAPHHCPHAISPTQQEAILGLKERYQTWGGRKLRQHLETLFPDTSWPAESSIGDLLTRHGWVEPRRYRRRTPRHSEPLAHCRAPNDVWSIDFKGQFRLGNGRWCYPLTVTDNDSRFLLGCEALTGTLGAPVHRVCERLFRAYGLPFAIRSDNGSPFAGCGLGGLSRLSVWWIKLGIQPERIVPGRPQQNGRHERFHKTLKAETTRPPAKDFRTQQRRFDRFRREFNEIRPHDALDGATPGTRHHVSPRVFPSRLPVVEYPPKMAVRRVRSNGEIKWKNRLVYLSGVLAGELVGLCQIDNECWEIFFGHVRLAVVDERLGKVRRPA